MFTPVQRAYNGRLSVPMCHPSALIQTKAGIKGTAARNEVTSKMAFHHDDSGSKKWKKQTFLFTCYELVTHCDILSLLQLTGVSVYMVPFFFFCFLQTMFELCCQLCAACPAFV